ncbi:6902_t:CDS:1, partial [Ambispora gerdemannii]
SSIIKKTIANNDEFDKNHNIAAEDFDNSDAASNSVEKLNRQNNTNIEDETFVLGGMD